MASAFWVIGITLATTVLGWGIFSVIQRENRRNDAYKKAASIWLDTTHSAAFADAIWTMTRDSRFAAPGWFLLGCDHLQQGRTKDAAKAFGMAHHCDFRLISAALLTFACLKTREDCDDDLARQTIATWEEMKRPDLQESDQDRRMMSCLEKKKGRPPAGSPPAQLIWLLASQTEQPNT